MLRSNLYCTDSHDDMIIRSGALLTPSSETQGLLARTMQYFPHTFLPPKNKKTILHINRLAATHQCIVDCYSTGIMNYLLKKGFMWC